MADMDLEAIRERTRVLDLRYVDSPQICDDIEELFATIDRLKPIVKEYEEMFDALDKAFREPEKFYVSTNLKKLALLETILDKFKMQQEAR